MKNCIIVFIGILLLSCKVILNQPQKERELPFRAIDYSVKWEGKAKLVTTYKEALRIGLTQKSNKNERFYSKNAVYLFEVGGGCFGASPSEISVTLKNNIININWEEPNELCPEVGEMSAFWGEIIINKKDYTNYERLKVKYYWEE